MRHALCLCLVRILAAGYDGGNMYTASRQFLAKQRRDALMCVLDQGALALHTRGEAEGANGTDGRETVKG